MDVYTIVIVGSILIIGPLVLYALAMASRLLLWWMLGIEDQLKEARRTNELLESLLKLQQSDIDHR